jgi:acetylornithine deacetylase
VGADLTELVAIPSVDGSPEEAEVQGWCADRLSALDLEVNHWLTDVRDLADDPAYPGMEVERDRVAGA